MIQLRYLVFICIQFWKYAHNILCVIFMPNLSICKLYVCICKKLCMYDRARMWGLFEPCISSGNTPQLCCNCRSVSSLCLSVSLLFPSLWGRGGVYDSGSTCEKRHRKIVPCFLLLRTLCFTSWSALFAGVTVERRKSFSKHSFPWLCCHVVKNSSIFFLRETDDWARG